MRYCLDLTNEQAQFLQKLQEEAKQSQLRLAVAIQAIIAGRGIPDGADFVGFESQVAEGATHLNGALPKCEGPVPMLAFVTIEAPKNA